MASVALSAGGGRPAVLSPATRQSLQGAALFVAAIAIGMANFVAVLDTTIANVSVPTIAGALGISSTQGTWIITSYAVAEAITVPLTGFLTRRFGAKRTFLFCFAAFGIISALCGLANSIGMLLAGRVLLGLSGGPLIPLSQMLLLRIFPPEQKTIATVIWSMTSLIGPIVGPILGGIICDTIGWQWIFFIKVPVALGGAALAWFMLRGQDDPTEAGDRFDGVGLGLLILWVGALQIMLDEGRNADWFAAHEIRVLGVTALIGFIAFVMWELTQKNPIVDLRIFRHRGFSMSVLTYAAGFGAFFATLVLLPLWLQQNMGYTATQAGYATGVMGIFAVLVAPLVGKLTESVDPRLLISIGLLGLGFTDYLRTGFSSQTTFQAIAIPTLLMGPFVVMFFVPLTGLALATVDPDETASAAGLSNFVRTLAGAFATSLVQTTWANSGRLNQTELAGAMSNAGAAIEAMVANGIPHDGAVAMIDQLVEQQATMLATVDTFALLTMLFAVSAALIWLTPKPEGPIDTNAAH